MNPSTLTAQLQFLRRLLVGVIAGLVGGALIYAAGWWLADGLTGRIQWALSTPYRPDVASLINTQATIESLNTAGNAAGGPIQVQVLAVAVGFGEQSYFNTNLSSFMSLAINTASQNACLESLIIALSLRDISAGPIPTKTCFPAIHESDPRKLSTMHEQAEARYQTLLSELASARAAAGLSPGPAVQEQIRNLSWESTILGLETGQVELVQSFQAVKRGDVVSALELAREYSVSAQSDFKYLEQLVQDVEIMAPTVQDWHQAHHNATLEDRRWTDVKVAAYDVVHDLSYVTDSTSGIYQHMGGVEGAIRPFVEEQRQLHGAELVQSLTASDVVEQHLQSALANSENLRKVLVSTLPLTQARVSTEMAALRAELFSLQIWHLTWGVLAGLIGALLGELMVRLRHWIVWAQASWRGHAPVGRDRLYSDAVFPLAGLMLAMLVSVRLTDSLDELTDTLISPLVSLAVQSWLGYIACVLALGALGTVIGGLTGRFLVPATSRGAIAETDVWLTGTGGVLAGVAVAVVLRWLVGPSAEAAVAEAGVFSMEAYLLSLALVGGLFGSLVGATLLSGKSRSPAHVGD